MLSILLCVKTGDLIYSLKSPRDRYAVGPKKYDSLPIWAVALKIIPSMIELSTLARTRASICHLIEFLINITVEL